MADPSLYTAALEYHHFPDKYEGPKSQLKARKYQPQYVYKNIFPGRTCVAHEGQDLVITATNGFGICQVEVNPTVQRPIHFKIVLNPHTYNNTNCVLVTQSQVVEDYNAAYRRYGRDASDGIDLERQLRYVEGTVSIRGNDVVTAVGDVSMFMPREEKIYLSLFTQSTIRFSLC